jgi:hypothetical protein
MLRRVVRFLGNVVSGSPDEEEKYPSLVLLLEDPISLAQEAILKLAIEVWGDSDSQGSIERGRHGRLWTVSVSDVLFGFRGGTGRYRRPRHEANQARQRVWDRHQAWLEVDYPDGAKIPEPEWPGCYKLLFLMANHLWSENCLGIYLPVQGVTVPNMGELIASIRWAATNGTPLPFLHDREEREA